MGWAVLPQSFDAGSGSGRRYECERTPDTHYFTRLWCFARGPCKLLEGVAEGARGKLLTFSTVLMRADFAQLLIMLLDPGSRA
jgi:hypothetical protein